MITFSKKTDEEMCPWVIYKNECIGSIDKYPPFSYTEYSLYIYNEILQPSYYTEVFHILRSCESTDVFNIYINSPGGDITTLCSFAAAIDNTSAVVLCHVDGDATSAAFILACMGEEIYFSNFAQMMSHNVRIGISATDMANLDKFMQNTKITYEGLLKKYGSKILTSKEIDEICNEGKEIHLSAEECRKRLNEWNDKQKKSDGSSKKKKKK